MSNLDRHIQAKQNKLDSLEQTLKDIQLQLANLSQELRVEQQLAKAQETIKKEFAGVKSQVAKLVKDACSCFDGFGGNDCSVVCFSFFVEIVTKHSGGSLPGMPTFLLWPRILSVF